jgi:predicted ferric reductase
MRRVIQSAFWIGAYLILTLAPLLILLVGPTPPGRGFWTEFSVALGFVGLTIMGFQFLMTARVRQITAPFGMDIIYHFHRQISWVALLLILAHPLILFVEDPANLQLLNVLDAPWRARWGVASIAALLILVITSIWRLQLKLRYESWRLWHGMLGTLAVASAMAHIALVAHYVETPWKRGFWIAITVFWIGLLVYVRIVKPLLMLRRPWRVAEVIPERNESWTLVLQPEGHRGVGFKPGQFAWLTLWNSPYAVKEHPFSFSSHPRADGRVSFTIKALGDFTNTIKDVQPGKRAYLDGPYGVFSVDRHPAAGYLFVAGGIGITPIMSMLRTLAERGDDRPLTLIYANKNWDDITFREELDELQRRLNLQVVHVLEEPPPDWNGATGFVTAGILEKQLPEDRTSREIFICGPDPMMDAVEAALSKLGVPLANYHSERYNFV